MEISINDGIRGDLVRITIFRQLAYSDFEPESRELFSSLYRCNDCVVGAVP